MAEKSIYDDIQVFRKERAYDSSKGCPACEWNDGMITKLCWTHEVYQEAEKREAVLRKLLKEGLFKIDQLSKSWVMPSGLDDFRKRVKAALEVK